MVSGSADLIDTLWNVKYFGIMADIDHGDGFNRYIVECKGFLCRPSPLHRSTRFNRYIVECKEVALIVQLAASARFNRYIVECKGYSCDLHGFCYQLI